GWSVVASPSPSVTRNFLFSVSCVSVAACTAVGSHNVNGRSRTLIESWNGTSWSVVPSRNPSRSGDLLADVSCTSAATCTAVGSYSSGGPNRKTLIESWDGTSWSLVPSPSPGPEINELAGASCVSAAACTAAGTDGGTGYSRTLIESGSASG